MASLADTLGPIAARLGEPEGEPVALEGGITNRNYKVRFAGEDLVVRLPGKDTGLLGIDRAAERAAGELARTPGCWGSTARRSGRRGSWRRRPGSRRKWWRCSTTHPAW
jgi:hypothetical protein